MNWECSILTSHLSRYLRNNQAPTEEDEERILSLREFLKTQIRSTIRLHNKTSDDTHLDALKFSLQRCQILLSPCRRLPTELWGEIFVHCLSVERHAMLSYEEAPLFLTHVSVLWKDVALLTPQLWTCIEINLRRAPQNPWSPRSGPREEASRAPPQHQQVEQWLRLSGSLPLKIVISAPGVCHCDGDAMDPSHSKLLETVFSFSNRLQWLNIDMCMTDNSQLPVPPNLNLPLLETLFLPLMWTWDSSDPPSKIHTPRLRDLTIDIIDIQLPTIWSKLRKLTINSIIDYPQARQLLTHCECLNDCSLKISFLTESTYPVDDVIVTIFHPHLEHLEISSSEDDYLPPDAFFQDLHPANLRTFSWMICEESGLDPSLERDINPGSINYLPRLWNLEKLTIHILGRYVWIPSNIMLRSLKHMPVSVKRIILMQTTGPAYPLSPNELLPTVLGLLSTPQQGTGNAGESANSTFLLPNLEAVELACYSQAQILLNDYVLPLILSRTSSGPSLRLTTFCAVLLMDDRDKLDERDVLDKFSSTVFRHTKRLDIPFKLLLYISPLHSCIKRLKSSFGFDPLAMDISCFLLTSDGFPCFCEKRMCASEVTN